MSRKFIEMLRSDPGYAATLAAAPDDETRRKVAAAAEALAAKIGEVMDPFMATAENNPNFASALREAVGRKS